MDKITPLSYTEVLTINEMAHELGLNRSIKPDYLRQEMDPLSLCPAWVVVPHHQRGELNDPPHHRLRVVLNERGAGVHIDVPASVWNFITMRTKVAEAVSAND